MAPIAGVAGQTPESKATAPAADFEKLISAAEFRQSGLQQLAPEQLAFLNSWLTKYTYAISALSSIGRHQSALLQPRRLSRAISMASSKGGRARQS